MTTCTIIRLGRADEFGRAFVVGQVYTGTQAFVRDLVVSGYATTTDSLVDGGFPANIAPADSMNSAQVSAVQALVSGAGFPVSCPMSVTLVGDSIHAYGDNIGAGGTGIGETSQSLVAWANAYLAGVPFKVVANRAVAGTLIDTAAANSLIGTGSTPQIPLALADSSYALWIHSGVNHLSSVIDASAPTVAQILEKFDRLLAVVAPRKQLIILDTLTPSRADSPSPASSVARRADVPLINAGLVAICAKYRNVLLNDIHTPLALDNAGNANPNYITAANGIHLTTWGAQVAGAASAKNICTAVTRMPAYRVTKPVMLPDVAGSGGTATPGSGSISGTVAANYALVISSGTGVVTASVSGRKQTISVNNTAGGASCVVTFSLSNKAGFLGTLANGDLVSAFGRITCLSQTGLRRCNLSFVLNPSGTPVQIDAMALAFQEFNDSGSLGVALPLFPPSFDGVFVTRPFALTASPTSADVIFTASIAAGGSASFEVSGLGYDGIA